MGKMGLGITFAIAIFATVIALDLLFFRSNPLGRLVANIAIVGFYASIYLLFFKRK